MARALINVPPKAKRGEIIEIKTLISHEMETGFRPRHRRQLIPRDIITRSSAPITARRSSAPSFFPAIAANPFITFSHGGDRERHASTFNWTGDNGFAATETATITVE